MSYIRRGGQIQTRGKSCTPSRKGVTQASKAASVERMAESKKKEERNEPYTREEFDAIRRHEEQLDLERLRRIKLEYEKSDRIIRRLEAERRRNELREDQ